MNAKKILAIAIVVLAVFACLNAVSAGFLDFLNPEQFLQGDGSQVKIPNNYTIDDKKMVASCNGVNISFVAQRSSDDKFESDFFAAIKEDGKDAGYENVANKTINGYEVHEFSGKLANLKNMTVPTTAVAGTDEAWIEYPPDLAAPVDKSVDHFRSVTYIKDGKEHKLLIYTTNSTVDLYTPEIEGIINSIGPMESK